MRISADYEIRDAVELPFVRLERHLRE